MSNRAIDRVIEHWRATRGRRNSTKGFGAGGAGIDIYWGPWTLGEQDRAFPMFPPRITSSTFARVLIVKAQDQAGTPLFADVEETELLAEADPREVMRIANLMLEDLNRDGRAADDSKGACGPAVDSKGADPNPQ